MTETVEITALTYGGRGLGRIDEKVIFVPFTVPGDICEVEVTKDRKNFSEGRLINVVTPSPDRVLKPKCPVFTECGGCHWQHIDYKAQLKWKTQILRETIERASGTTLPKDLETIASSKEYNYRTSVSLHIKDGKWGFFAPASHDIIDIDDCPLLDERLNEALRGLKALKLPSFIEASIHSLDMVVDLLANEKEGKEGDEGSIVAIFYVSEKILGFDWSEALEGLDLKGFEVRLKKQLKNQPTRGRGKSILRRGNLTAGYMVDGLKIDGLASTFRQANTLQNALMVEKVIDYSELTKETEVLDLFCGVGNLTLPLAKRSKKVLGIDVDSDAIKNAIENGELNKIDNVEFLASEATLKNFRISTPKDKGALPHSKDLEKETHRVVILDPPRAGAKAAIAEIAAAKIERVIYVSCDPATLARDIKVLKEAGYAIDKAACIDMFSETYHIEAIVGLSLI